MKTRFVLIVGASAFVTFGLLFAAQGIFAEKPETTASASELQPPETSTGSPTGLDVTKSDDRESLAKNLAEAVHSLGNAPNPPPDRRIPVLAPTPPLLQLFLDSNPSFDQESLEAGRTAKEIRRWLRITVQDAIADCWKKGSGPPPWLEFAADLSSRAPEVLTVSNLRLTKVHGDFVLTSADRTCIEENVAAIGGRSISAEEMAILKDRLPLTESFIFQWPCSGCGHTPSAPAAAR